VDNPSHPRLQLRARAQDRRQPQQVPRLLLPRSALQKRDATPAAGDVAPSGVPGGDAAAAAAWHDDDGAATRTSQELRGPHQERATLHLRRRPDQVLGGRQERDERVGRLSRRERQSFAEEQP